MKENRQHTFLRNDVPGSAAYAFASILAVWYQVCNIYRVKPFIMTIEQFNRLNRGQRLEAIWNTGNFLTKLSDGNYNYELYSIENFLIELVSEKSKPGSFSIRLRQAALNN